MFVPMKMTFSAGGRSTEMYDRVLDLTARQLMAFEHEAGDMTEPLTSVAADLRTAVAAITGSQGEAGATGKWTPLSHDYGAWKAQRAPGVKMLVGLMPVGDLTEGKDSLGRRRMRRDYGPSGRMLRTLLTPITDKVTWHIAPKRLAYLPTSDIAGYHETGTEKMPARPPVDLTPAFLHSIDREFAVWLAAVIKRNDL